MRDSIHLGWDLKGKISFEEFEKLLSSFLTETRYLQFSIVRLCEESKPNKDQALDFFRKFLADFTSKTLKYIDETLDD